MGLGQNRNGSAFQKSEQALAIGDRDPVVARDQDARALQGISIT